MGTLGFLGIGLLLVTFRTRFSVDEKRLVILKETRINEILIVNKKKRGKGYINAVVPFGYDLNSYDVYFGLKNNVFLIIKTDRRRAIKIAEFIQSVTQVEYSIKDNFDSQHLVNENSTFSFINETSGHVDLSLFDIRGRKISTILNNVAPPGIHFIPIGKHTQGNEVYFC